MNNCVEKPQRGAASVAVNSGNMKVGASRRNMTRIVAVRCTSTGIPAILLQTLRRAAAKIALQCTSACTAG
jgi:hypothetical protein